MELCVCYRKLVFFFWLCLNLNEIKLELGILHKVLIYTLVKFCIFFWLVSVICLSFFREVVYLCV